MKILKANAGPLTNFEVLDFLRSIGAGKDERIMAGIAPSKIKVYDYLEQSTACNQTREIVTECVEKCKKFNLAKAEILNIINIRPSSLVEFDSIVEECEKRYGEIGDELVEMVMQVLPPSKQTESEEGEGEDNEDGNGEDKEDGKGEDKEDGEGEDNEDGEGEDNEEGEGEEN